MWSEALPIVVYSTFTQVQVRVPDWARLYASLQALKGHVQEYPGCQKLEAFVHAEAEGAVRVHCYTTWDTPEQLEAFLERGYTFERMLVDVAGITAQPTLVMEKVF